MRLPFQRIARVSEQSIVCACGPTLLLIDSTGEAVVESAPSESHTGLVRLLLVSVDGRLLVTSGDDKLLKFWDLPSLTLRRSVSLAKRATSVQFSADGMYILVADKFGDVYRYLVEAPESSKAASKAKPLLGHVSLLTSMYASKDGKRIITADRDEHIRISRYPESWDIVAYLGGHERFVSALCAVSDDRYLLSAGGDDDLFVWNLSTYKLVRRIDISALAEYSQVPAPRQEAMTKKFKYRQKKRNVDGMADDESDVPVHFRNLAVSKMAIFQADLVIVSAAGSSALLYFPLDALEKKVDISARLIDLGQPVLDFDCSGTSIIVSLDRSRLPDVHKAPCCRSLQLKEGALQLIVDGLALEKAYRQANDASQVPDDDALYGELSYLVKDPAEAAGYREDGAKKARIDAEAPDLAL